MNVNNPFFLLLLFKTMAFKCTILTHLLLLSIICVLAHEESDLVLDVPPDEISDSEETDRVSQHMFKLYEKYNREPQWPRNINTVRSFKAKPGELISISSSIWTDSMYFTYCKNIYESHFESKLTVVQSIQDCTVFSCRVHSLQSCKNKTNVLYCIHKCPKLFSRFS